MSAANDAGCKPARESCRACRMSKVRCDLESNPHGCSRCARAGMQCLPNQPSQRGRCRSKPYPRSADHAARRCGGRIDDDSRPAARSDDTRLRHAGRAGARVEAGSNALLSTTAVLADGVAAGFSARPPCAPSPYAAVRERPLARLLGSSTWALHRQALADLGSRVASLHFARSALAIAARNNSYVEIFGALQLAQELGVEHAEAMRALQHATAIASTDPLVLDSASGPIPAGCPDFVSEWMSDACTFPCALRVERDGLVRWETNTSMRQLKAVVGELADVVRAQGGRLGEFVHVPSVRLAPDAPAHEDADDDAGKPGLDDHFYAVFREQADRATVAALTASLWAQIAPDAQGLVAQHALGEGRAPVHPYIADIRSNDLRLSARLVAKDGGRRSWIAYRFVQWDPHGAQARIDAVCTSAGALPRGADLFEEIYTPCGLRVPVAGLRPQRLGAQSSGEAPERVLPSISAYDPATPALSGSLRADGACFAARSSSSDEETAGARRAACTRTSLGVQPMPDGGQPHTEAEDELDDLPLDDLLDELARATGVVDDDAEGWSNGNGTVRRAVQCC